MRGHRRLPYLGRRRAGWPPGDGPGGVDRCFGRSGGAVAAYTGSRVNERGRASRRTDFVQLFEESPIRPHMGEV